MRLHRDCARQKQYNRQRSRRSLRVALTNLIGPADVTARLRLVIPGLARKRVILGWISDPGSNNRVHAAREGTGRLG